MATSAAHQIPSEGETLGYMDELSNWGRWGDDDERGTLNFITPDVRRAAVTQVREGIALSIGRDMLTTPPHPPRPADLLGPIQRFMIMTGEGLRDEHSVKPFASERWSAGVEWIGFVCHGYELTHMDGFSHMAWDGKMYGGAPAEHVNSWSGATSLPITSTMGDGIMTKGILIDAPRLRGVEWLEPGEGLLPRDLEQAEAELGITIGEGDAVLLRTGYLRMKEQREVQIEGKDVTEAVSGNHKPGWHASCMPLLHERKVSLFGSDVDLDVVPSGYAWASHPCHIIALIAMGLPILDAANLEGLATKCAELGRYEFLLTINPLRIEGGTGSPVNPIATF